MPEATEEEGKQILPEVPPAGSIGKLEPDPNHPEVKTGKIKLKVYVTSDGTVFTDRQQALTHKEFLGEKDKSQG